MEYGINNMPTSFHDRITSALADKNLQAALDSNTELRIQGRLKAFASLPDVQGMRQRAHTVRADVIANLDRYLDQFITQVTAHGITVPRAVAEILEGLRRALREEGLRSIGDLVGTWMV